MLRLLPLAEPLGECNLEIVCGVIDCGQECEGNPECEANCAAACVEAPQLCQCDEQDIAEGCFGAPPPG